MDEPKAKRLKLESEQDQEVKDHPVDDDQPDEVNGPSLLSLNDDCCLAIFEVLPLNDLCAISNTCMRFQVLSKDVYRRRYKSKVLLIENILADGNMVLGPDEKYTKCFAEYIQNVSLGQNVASKAGLEGLKTFYKANQKDEDQGSDEGKNRISSPIKTLRFENWRSGLRKSHGPVLADIVQGVESVTFSNTKVVGDLNENMLQFLPNMKSLTLWNVLNEPNDEKVNWMERTYPKLEYFAWHLEREVPVEKMTRFFQSNPTIRTFSLRSVSGRTINGLMSEGIRIDELFFNMPSNISNGLDVLHVLCTQQIGPVKLHLKFSDQVRAVLKQNLRQLAALGPYIEGLYFEDDYVDEGLIKEIVKFKNLKMIQLNIPPVKTAVWLTTMSNLEEIFFCRGVSQSNFSRYHKVMRVLAGQMRNLKKVYIRNNSRDFDEFGLGEFNEMRRKLTNAQKLKIYFKTDQERSTGRLNSTVCEFDKIEAMRVETENFNNPLVTEYLTTKGVSGRYFRRYLRRRYLWN